MRKLRSIQVLRGIAASAVVVHHAYRSVDPNSFVRVGAAGVDLFFVISGFIMATIGLGRSPGAFIADRLWRIFPLWLIAVSPWFLLGHPDRPTTLASLTLWPIWHGQFYSPALLLGWTLCFEMLFYWAFTLGLATRALVPLGLFFACLIIGPRNDLLAYLGSPLILEFLAGVGIALLRPSRYGGALILAGLLWFAAAPQTYYNELIGAGAYLRLVAWGVPAALIVYGARALEPRFAGRTLAPLVMLGDASYSIYLFHFIPVEILGRHWLPAIAAGIGTGLTAHWLVERPIMALRPLLRRYAGLRAIVSAAQEQAVLVRPPPHVAGSKAPAPFHATKPAPETPD
jgi:exopolysaccharide production protein ExoZ